jgi:eukaryotic-like serine/threonine-protein kinase
VTLAKEDLVILAGLLDRMLELPAESRGAWIAGLEETHPRLVPALRQILSREGQIETRDFLGTLPKFLDETFTTAESGSAHAGDAVGPYRLIREIGRGGMSTVWQAVRTDGSLKRDVALKLPHSGLRGPEFAERLARERDILAALTHPHIARLYDAGVSASGQPYLAMEYVEGTPLTHYCDQRRLPIRERAKLFLQVLGAVHFAHSQLIIHRDLKPSNILVTDHGRAILLDFGIAKILVEGQAQETELTQYGGRAMTPTYASPEQITGQPVGTASDTYSLGVLLFEVLTGQLPYRPKRDSRGALEDAVVGEEPQRPSQCPSESAAAARNTTPKKLRSLLSGDLDTIVLEALKKRPAERYATVSALQQDIERYLDGRPILARPDSRWYVARKFIARNKVPVGVGAVALLAVLAAAGIAFREASLARAKRDQALQLASRSEAVSDFMDILIGDAAGSGKPITIGQMLARSEELAASEFRDNTDHRAAVLDVLAVHYHTAGDDVRSERLLREALDLMRRTSDPSLRAKLTCDHGIALAALGKVADAMKSLSSVANDPETTDEQASGCLAYLSNIAEDINDVGAALQYAEQALQRLQAVPGARASSLALLLGNMGYAEHLNGRNDVAEHYYERALAKLTEAGRERSPYAVEMRNNWAIVSDGSGNPRRALELYDQTLQIVAQQESGERPPPYLLGNRARALQSLGRYDESASAYLSCVATATGSVAAYCLSGLASVSRSRGDLASAENYLERAATLLGARATTSSPATLALSITKAEIAMSRGQLDTARTILTTAMEGHKTTSAAAMALIDRAEVDLAESRLQEAADDAREALSITQTQQGGEPYSNRSGLAWLMLGRILAREGSTAEAAKAVQAALSHFQNTVDPVHPAVQQAQNLLDTLSKNQ